MTFPPHTHKPYNRIKQLKPILTFMLFILSVSVHGQLQNNVFPIWTYHRKNINIHGISLGLASVFNEPKLTNTNGIKLELIGVGILIPLIPQSPIAQNDSAFAELMKDPVSERINGLNLSLSGTACDCVTNGVSAGFVGQITRKVNGFSASVFMNFAQVNNGVQSAFFFNESYKLRGLQLGISNHAHYAKGFQVGLFNSSRKLKGIQLGLWNVNDKRKMPFINWNFKDYPVMSFEEDMRVQDSLRNAADSVFRSKQTERQNLTSMKVEAGVLAPLGNLNKVMGVSPNFGFWLERGLSNKMKNTSLAIGISLFAPLQSRPFTYTLPDTTLKARVKGPSGIIGLQGAHSFKVKSNSLLNRIDLLVGVAYGFLQTDQVMPQKSKEGNPLHYYVYTMHFSGGITFRKMLTENKSVGLSVRYNLAPPTLISNNVSSNFGGSSFTSSLQFRFNSL